MAICKEDFAEVDFSTGTIHRSFQEKNIGEGDKNGDRFGIRCFRNGTPVNIQDCTVTGYFIRADGTTIIIGGITVNNAAYVELTESCYSVDGKFTLSIKLSNGETATTVRIVDGVVVNTTTESIIDPGGVIPDMAELLALAERVEDAAAAVAEFSVYTQLISGSDYALVVVSTEQ